jgi:hypothetical protein
MRKLFVVVALVGCASSNFVATFTYGGPSNLALPLNQSAERAFKVHPITPERQKLIEAVQVFMDSLPRELTLKNNVVEVAEGVEARLIGSVEVKAVLAAPFDDAGYVPALQRAAEAAGANLAFCPRNEKPEWYCWRCYLAKTGKP